MLRDAVTRSRASPPRSARFHFNAAGIHAATATAPALWGTAVLPPCLPAEVGLRGGSSSARRQHSSVLSRDLQHQSKNNRKRARRAAFCLTLSSSIWQSQQQQLYAVQGAFMLQEAPGARSCECCEGTEPRCRRKSTAALLQ